MEVGVHHEELQISCSDSQIRTERKPSPTTQGFEVAPQAQSVQILPENIRYCLRRGRHLWDTRACHKVRARLHSEDIPHSELYTQATTRIP